MAFTRRKFLQATGIGVGASTLGFPAIGNAQSDQYPSKPINMIIASAAGGSSDLTSRTLAPLSQEVFGQPMILQIRPGGGGAVGNELVYQAKPDGYTLSFGHSNWNSVLPALEGRSRGPGEMEPVCRINLQNVIYWVAADSPFKSMQDVINYAKANPGKLSFGNSGLWSVTDIMWRWFELKAGLKTRNVTFAGGGETIVALLGGHIQISSIGPPQSLPHYRAGKIRPLAIEARKRYRGLPNVPAMKELGYDNGLEGLWKAVLAPKGTPRPIIEKLAAGFKKMTEDKRAIDALDQLGEDFEYQGTDEFAKYWQEDFAIYKEMAKLFKAP
jgi:tripartite-type tricarboxylate transporter receptor subunit TctC